MLYQRHPMETNEEVIRVVRFGSKSLSKWQQSYGPTKLDLLGMVTAILDCFGRGPPKDHFSKVWLRLAQ
jgi:hypothetical protein